MSRPTYSFVFPVYNEEETLPELFRRMQDLLMRLDGPAEVILVDDGSRDQSYAMMREFHHQDTRFQAVRLSRNFGHQVAITAGMDVARGQAICIMDADLQDPPELVLEMIERWKEGNEVVFAVRKQRQNEKASKVFMTLLFYRLLRKLTDLDIPVDVGDFRLVDRKAMDAFRSMREESRYVRGMFSWVGFRQVGVEYVRPGRFAGETKYPFRKLLKLALDGIFSFSNAPLRLALNLGTFVAVAAFLFGTVLVALKLCGLYIVTGWTSLIVALSFFSGVQLMVLGVMGEYLGRIYGEVKQRPLYVVSEWLGADAQVAASIRRGYISG